VTAGAAAADISHRTGRSRAGLKKLGEIAYLVMSPGVVPRLSRPRRVDRDRRVAGGHAPVFTAMIGNTREWRRRHEAAAGRRLRRRRARPGRGGRRLALGVLFGIMPKLYSGAHVHPSQGAERRGTSFRFDSAVETLVDLDGEMVGRLPLEVTVLPQAFRVGTV
jgi:hypothetical protein